MMGDIPVLPGVSRRTRAGIALLAITLAACAAGESRTTPDRGNAPSATATLTPSARATAPDTRAGGNFLAPGSDPAVLPGPILIADEGNNRAVLIDPTGRVLWQFPQPGDLPAGETFLVPDDTFFSADHKTIVATEEENAVVSLIDMASRTITYRYGQPGVPGSGPNRLANPDDALMLPDGSILTADIKNCRILRIAAHNARSGSHLRHDRGLSAPPANNVRLAERGLPAQRRQPARHRDQR